MLTLRRAILLFLTVTTFSRVPPILPVQTWVQNPYNPIIYATQEWEENSVYEPSVIYKDGLYRMWYTGGQSSCAIGYAESNDGHGWRKYSGPILGGGIGGWDGIACRNSVTYDNGVYYLYFVDAHSAGAKLHVATSADGIHFTTYPKPVFEPQGWTQGIANTAVWRDGSTWWLMYEGQAKGYMLWKIALANGNSPFAFTNINDEPINALQRSWGMWGGPSVARRAAPDYGYQTPSYDLWYTASFDDVIPTDIYYAHSPDLVKWKTHPTPVVKREQFWEVDQVADPYYLEVKAHKLIFFDGCDNSDLAKVTCAIGLATQAP